MRNILSLLLLAFTLSSLQAADPLRVFIRGGEKSHGPSGNGVHEHELFLEQAGAFLRERGMQVEGAKYFPTAEQLRRTDVLVMYAQEGGHIPENRRAGLEAFLKRGGGMVVIHTATVPENVPGSSDYLKSIIGGSWVWGETKWLEGPISLYYVDRTHPITDGVANFDVNDEIYYDMDISEDVQVLAAAYTPNLTGSRRDDPRGRPGEGVVTVYDIAPQMWTYENQLEGGEPYRAFVSIPGHLFSTFELPHYRAVLLRGISWVAKKDNVDGYATTEELETLIYPEGGPSSPKDSIEQLSIHPDFTVSEIASEPLVNKPMNIDWDEKGRMWVAETPEYPDGRWANDKSDLVQRWQPEAPIGPDGRYQRPAHDKVSILSDTDGDGVMDAKQVFYEGLELVTSLVVYKDGCIVSQAPDILHLRDTDGDGEADTVEKLYTNLGTGDTHAVLNNLRWGWDGWIYGTHGYSSSRNVMSGDGRTDFGNIGSGVVRFKPDGSAIEQYSSKGGNTWGLQVTWDNEVFWTQPTSGDLLMHTVMGENLMEKGRVRGTATYEIVSKSITTYPPIAYEQLPYVQIDQVGRFTAAAGTVIYDGGSWPDAWDYNYLTTECTINLVHHQIVKPNGVTFTSHKAADREEEEFITGQDYWFRPIEVRVGPDGAVYLIDFYNQAVIHNDTRGPKHGPRNAAIRPDRDHYYGRIYRIDHKSTRRFTVPDLSEMSDSELASALKHANRHIRMNAARLLIEGARTGALGELKQLVAGESAEASVAALWTLERLNRLDDVTLNRAAGHPHAAVRKNAMMVAAERTGSGGSQPEAVVQRLKDSDPRVRLEALKALAATGIHAEAAQAMVEVYPQLNDDWSRSAFLAASSHAPALVLNEALASSNGSEALIGQLTRQLIDSEDARQVARLVESLASQPESRNAAKLSALQQLVTELDEGVVPNWNNSLKSSLESLIESSNPTVSANAIALAVRWDRQSELSDRVDEQIERNLDRLTDASLNDETRARIATALLGVRQVNDQVIPAVAGLLGSDASAGLQGRILESMGNLADEAIGEQLVEAFPNLNPELQQTTLNILLRRVPWSMELLSALGSGELSADLLGPANIHRLRLHPDESVSSRANELMNQIRGPVADEKAQIISGLLPAVTQPGDVENGKQLFEVACATCHEFNDIGQMVGPPLTGMGAHGPAELLGHIIDPNREVDFSFVAWTVETKDGELYDGIVTRENNSMVALRNAAGEVEISKDNIETRRNTGRSLMPEGFESLGEEGMRDLLAYMTADVKRFRILDLTGVFNVSSTEGIYASRERNGGMVQLRRFGTIKVGEVPFDILSPERTAGGRNLLTLRGRQGITPEYPESVTFEVGAEANRVHFLSGIGGWAYPWNGDNLENVPVVKTTVHYADGGTEELVFRNGVEFADYIGSFDVPGSQAVDGLVRSGQVRYFSKDLKRTAMIERITLSSYNNPVAPTIVGITVEKAEPGSASGPVESNATSAIEWGDGVKALLIGGGASHDYDRWFDEEDSKILARTGRYAPKYFEPQELTAEIVRSADVILISANKAFPDPAVKEAIFNHVESGKGLILLHPGLWYNWGDWPEFNRELAGGGSRGHDRFGTFEVTRNGKDHPLVQDVPDRFTITDELYYFEPDSQGTPIEVLATAHSESRNKTYPQVFVVRHPDARIAGITLGHDGQAHNHPAFQTLLINAFDWVSDK